MSTKNKEETRGRKELPPAKKRRNQYKIWLNDEEWGQITSAGTSAWARTVLLRAAKREARNGK